MRLFQLKYTDNPIRCSLSVDPGINSSGFTHINACMSEVQIWGWKADLKPTRLAFPYLYSVMARISRQMVDQCRGWGAIEMTEVIVEYPLVGRGFSYGLTGQIIMFLKELGSRANIPRITFVPPTIPEFFLRKRSVSDTETVKYVLANFQPVLGDRKRVSAHECDSLLFSYLRHSKFYQDTFGIQLEREPNFEIEQLEI